MGWIDMYGDNLNPELKPDLKRLLSDLRAELGVDVFADRSPIEQVMLAAEISVAADGFPSTDDLANNPLLMLRTIRRLKRLGLYD